jgi:hypothetical protein
VCVELLVADPREPCCPAPEALGLDAITLEGDHEAVISYADPVGYWNTHRRSNSRPAYGSAGLMHHCPRWERGTGEPPVSSVSRLQNELRLNDVNIRAATSVRRNQWSAAEIYPNPSCATPSP